MESIPTRKSRRSIFFYFGVPAWIASAVAIIAGGVVTWIASLAIWAKVLAGLSAILLVLLVAFVATLLFTPRGSFGETLRIDKVARGGWGKGLFGGCVIVVALILAAVMSTKPRTDHPTPVLQPGKTTLAQSAPPALQPTPKPVNNPQRPGALDADPPTIAKPQPLKRISPKPNVEVAETPKGGAPILPLPVASAPQPSPLVGTISVPSVATGGAVGISVGQQGGVTAGQVILNPSLKILIECVPIDGHSDVPIAYVNGRSVNVSNKAPGEIYVVTRYTCLTRYNGLTPEIMAAVERLKSIRHLTVLDTSPCGYAIQDKGGLQGLPFLGDADKPISICFFRKDLEGVAEKLRNALEVSTMSVSAVRFIEVPKGADVSHIKAYNFLVASGIDFEITF